MTRIPAWPLATLPALIRQRGEGTRTFSGAEPFRNVTRDPFVSPEPDAWAARGEEKMAGKESRRGARSASSYRPTGGGGVPGASLPVSPLPPHVHSVRHRRAAPPRAGAQGPRASAVSSPGCGPYWLGGPAHRAWGCIHGALAPHPRAPGTATVCSQRGSFKRHSSGGRL